MLQKQLLYKNGSVAYYTAGKGLPVLLLHGFAEDGSIWDEAAAHLATQYLVIVPDIPGSGRSAMITGSNVGVEEYVDAIKAILDYEHIGQAVMIGHSMGGYITLAFAEKYPEMLKAFGLFHSSAYADDAAKKEKRQKAIYFIEANGVEAFLKTSIPGLFANEEKSKEAIADLLAKGSLFTPEALIQYYMAMMQRPDRTAVLKTFEGKILFVMGKHDTAVPIKDALEQCHMPSVAYIHVLHNSGHMGMIEEKSKSFGILEDFLEANYV